MVKETLSSILESQPFRTSKQCQDLLRYMVNHSFSDDDTALKERVIGARVFGRQPAYNTNDDPVVRVRAADVRKRLAQYYQATGSETHLLRLDLQPGSYRLHFSQDRPVHEELFPMEGASEECNQDPELSPLLAASKRSWLSSLAVRIVALALLLATIGAFSRLAQLNWVSPQKRFWAPLTTGNQPVLIYLGSNAAYVFSTEFMVKYRAAHGIPYTGLDTFVDLPHDATVRADDLVPVKDTFETTADLAATVQITTLLGSWKKPFVLRSGRDLSFGDLRSKPSIMIGAFNNSWSLELTKDLPYSFRDGVRIENREHPGQGWTIPTDSLSGTTDDYALITRLLSSKTGGPVIIVAGIGEYGTQAAAEFVVNPDSMRDLLRTAPRGWENKNMQAVLNVKVVDYLPVAVHVAATSYW